MVFEWGSVASPAKILPKNNLSDEGSAVLQSETKER